MAGGAGIQNGYGGIAVFYNIQHAGQQVTGIQRTGLTRLEIDRHAPRILCAGDAVLQRGNVVAGAGDVMSAAEVEPLHIGQQIAKLFCHGIQRHGQCIGVLLAESVEVQSVQKLRQAGVLRHGGIPCCAGRTKAAAGRAGVVDRVAVLRGAFRVDAQPYAFARSLDLCTEFCQLCRGVKDDMVGIAQQLVHLVRAVGGAEYMDFFAGHLLGTQPCLKQAAGLGARQVRRQQGIQVIVAERLLRQQHPAAGALCQPAQNLRVTGQRGLVQQIAGCGQGGKFRRHCAADGRKWRPCIALYHQSTRTGLWFSLRGRPYLSSASRNGSGLNSSTV